jgi:hypothetical protein
MVNAPVVHVEHIIHKGGEHSNCSSYACSSTPPQSSSAGRERYVAASNNHYTHRHRQQPQQQEYYYDPVHVTAVTESDSAKQNYQERLAVYSATMGNNNKNSLHRRQQPQEQQHSSSVRTADSDELVQLLALQVYHLPGNNWGQDWLQYINNNHPVFGICCHSALHPIGSKTRIVALVGTIIFGLALTNAFYLFYLWNPQFDRVVAKVVTNGGDTLVLTTGMLLLWTLGGGVHCTFNLAMWHMAACACCRTGGCCEAVACCPSLGKHMIRVFVLGIVALGVMIVLLRVAINEKQDRINESGVVTDMEDGGNNMDNGIDIQIDDELGLDVQSASEFSFLLGYLVEIVLSLFIYYPIGGTLLFSGILSCGFKIPVLGGRPYEVACEERRKEKQQQNRGTRTGETTSMSLNSSAKDGKGPSRVSSTGDVEQAIEVNLR